jgi:hypothetical protein
MDSVIAPIIDLIVKGGPAAFGTLGWLLFVVERYYVNPSLQKKLEAQAEIFRREGKDLNYKILGVLNDFHIILEVIKDRLHRGE